MFNQIFLSIRVSENYYKFKDGKKNQTEIASLGFAKTQAEKFNTTTRTIITKTKIGEFILDEKLLDKTVDQFSKRKLSQRKVLEEIKAIEQNNADNKRSSERTTSGTPKPQEEADVKTEKVKARVEPVKKPEIIVELDDDAKYCRECKDGLQLTCPSCKDAFISCQHYKNPYLRRIDSKGCENYN